jgi:predicted ArsR family transcriptional regulator
LLHVVFQQKTEHYLTKLRGETPAERAKWLARLRDFDGHMAECETDDAGAVRIIEHHSPILDLLRAYPQVAKLESDMFQRLLGAPVRREETSASGLYCATFRLGGASLYGRGSSFCRGWAIRRARARASVGPMSPSTLE